MYIIEAVEQLRWEAVQVIATFYILQYIYILSTQEYVDEYTDWLLNKSIASQFDAFKDGFDLVMGQSFLADLFRPEELELMVCGSNVSQGANFQ